MARYLDVMDQPSIQVLLEYVDVQNGHIELTPLTADVEGESECTITFASSEITAIGQTPEEAQLKALYLLGKRLPTHYTMDATYSRPRDRY